MNSEQDIMYINLPGDLYSVVAGVAVQENVSIGRALETIISEWSKSLANQSINESKDEGVLQRLEGKVDELIHTADVLPCWEENKNDPDSPTNLSARFDTLEVLIQNVAHKIDCLPCRQ
ncbi:MAG: hypothetical protein ACRDBG_09925 [Waterburya sp.]